MNATRRKTPLFDLHAQDHAKFIDFHGWELPVQYTSIMDEHHSVRHAAGLFDISHMGQIMVQGPGAFGFLQRLTTGDIRRTLEKGVGVYAHLLRPSGGVIDDVFVYGLPGGQEFFVVVNGATHDKVLAWMRQNANDGVSIVDLTDRGALTIQGPRALGIIQRTVAGIAELPRFAFQKISGATPHESYWGCRTGYTGEEGAEFFGPAHTITLLWRQLLDNGKELGLKPCGLGARDTLRLEVGYPLYGHELSEDRTPLEANMEWAVKWGKGDFIGRAALEKQKRDGLKEQLLAYELKERGVPRPGSPIYKEGVRGGDTVSGTFSPTLQKGIGLAYAPISWNNPGASIEVEIHNKRMSAQVVALPFFKKPKGTL